MHSYAGLCCKWPIWDKNGSERGGGNGIKGQRRNLVSIWGVHAGGQPGWIYRGGLLANKSRMHAIARAVWRSGSTFNGRQQWPESEFGSSGWIANGCERLRPDIEIQILNSEYFGGHQANNAHKVNTLAATLIKTNLRTAGHVMRETKKATILHHQPSSSSSPPSDWTNMNERESKLAYLI